MCPLNERNSSTGTGQEQRATFKNNHHCAPRNLTVTFQEILPQDRRDRRRVFPHSGGFRSNGRWTALHRTSLSLPHLDSFVDFLGLDYVPMAPWVS